MSMRLEKKLARIVGQIRYRPTLASYSEVPNIAQELEPEFDEWQAAKNDDVTLFSPDKKKFIQTTSDIVTYVNESEENFEELGKYLKVIFDKIVTTSSIEEIRRIGVRSTKILQTEF